MPPEHGVRTARISALIPILRDGANSIADLRLTAKGKRLENQQIILVDFATGVGAGGPFRQGCDGYDLRPTAVDRLPDLRFLGKTAMEENLRDRTGSRRTRGAGGRPAAARRRGARRAPAAVPASPAHLYHAARSTSTRCSTRRGSRSSKPMPTRVLEEIGIDFRDDAEALQLWKEAGADVKGERVHFPQGPAALAAEDRAADLHPACAQSGALGRDRRQRHGVRAGLRPALRARPRRQAPLRHDRGFPQFREARLYGAVDPSFGRHGVRAGRRAGQQAPPRHGLCAHHAIPTSRSWAR